MQKRVLHSQKPVGRTILRELRKFVRAWIRENLVPLDPLEHTCELLEEWLAGSNYNGGRKNELRRAYEAVSIAGGLQPRDYDCKAFVKEEFYPEEKHARMIISRSDNFKAWVGPYIKKIEHELFHSEKTGHFFIKGVPVPEIPLKMDPLVREYPYVLETDYSSFEGSFTVEYQAAVEKQLFKYMLRNNPEICSDVMKTYGRHRAINKHFTATFVGSRLSGEMWTSLANGFSNLMNMLFIANRKQVIVDGFVEGDDGFFGVSNKSIDSSDYEQLGFTIKMSYACDARDLSFCGQFYHPDFLISLPDLEQVNRLGWTCKRQHFVRPHKFKCALLKAKALSLWYQGRAAPIANALAVTTFNAISGQPALDWDWWEREHLPTDIPAKLEYDAIPDEHRIMYADKYGVSPEAQKDLEGWFKSHPLEDFCLDLGTPSYVAGIEQLPVATLETRYTKHQVFQ